MSRKLLLLLPIGGLVFFAVGLDIGFLLKVFEPQFGADKIIVKWLFIEIATLLGGAISINCLIFFFFPPVILKVTKDKLVLASGMRYVPYEIPTKVEKVEIVMKEANLEVDGKKAIVEGGISIFLKHDPSYPSQMATSMGLGNFNYVLIVSTTYSDLDSKTMLAETKRILGLK